MVRHRPMWSIEAAKTLNQGSSCSTRVTSPLISDHLSCQSQVTLVRFNICCCRVRTGTEENKRRGGDRTLEKVARLRHSTASSTQDASCAFHTEQMDHLRRARSAPRTLRNLFLQQCSGRRAETERELVAACLASPLLPTDDTPSSAVTALSPPFTLHPFLHPSTFSPSIKSKGDNFTHFFFCFQLFDFNFSMCIPFSAGLIHFAKKSIRATKKNKTASFQKRH